MKLVTGAFIGAVLTVGILFVKGVLDRKPPVVLASSISPDSKWICEIVDIDPRGPVCEILIHAQEYRGRSHLERGYKGECIVMDFDSETITLDVRFSWHGTEVTIEGYPIRGSVRLLCSATGTMIVRDQSVPNP